MATPSSSVVSVTSAGLRIGIEGANETAVAGIRHHRDLLDAGFLEDAVDIIRP